MSQLGIVVIGRNEGERLRSCLASTVGPHRTVVYVDSGSSDGSVELARSMGAEVVELDLSLPFTAARARNAGFDRLQQIDPVVEFVQVVDGDCEVASGWLDRARAVLEERPDVAVVFGRRRERYRDRTVYNRLADLEWNTAPIGEVKACGGDALMRAEALRRVGGYNPSIIAAEDDELCIRIRAEGWKVLRIDADMTLHDMAMTRFSQWWKRAVRCGHAYAEGSARYGRTPERHFVRQTRSAIFWGIVLPALAFGLAWWTWGASLVLLAGYLVLFWRAERFYRAGRGWPAGDARVYGASCVLAKFAHVYGIAKYWTRRIRGTPVRIIEYRGAEAATSVPQP
ncbi:MAG: glycosyltransferase [Isosphaeraceae bacterium]